MRFRITIAAGLILVGLMLAAAAAHEIYAPESVAADGTGHFAYEILVVISEPVAFATSHFDGEDNTDLGAWWADGFCMTVIEPGNYVTAVEGNLVDPASDGSVYYSHTMCDNWTGEVTTIILAPVVGAEAESWSSVKAIFE